MTTTPVTQWPDGEIGDQVREALYGVLDPDLGINIVDFGFVLQARVENNVAILKMTLTSAACPLTKIMEDQIRANLVDTGIVADFRIEWAWVPAWTPEQITPEGQDQLRAVGFSFG